MDKIKTNASLEAFNTFRIPAKAKYLAKIETIEQAQSLLQEQPFANEQKLILGGGSNILFTKNFSGLVLKNGISGIEKVHEDNEHVWLRVGGGENWHQLVLYCINHNYAGIENLSLIPGTVGAAPIQNIGAYGVEFESVFDSLDALHLSGNRIDHFKHNDCHFSYRDSIFKNEFKNQYMIVNVTLKLNKKPTFQLNYGQLKTMLEEMGIDQPDIKNISSAVIKIRQSKLPDPNVTPNCGSFFKNPIVTAEQYQSLKSQYPELTGHKQGDHYKLSAAWLIEQCGFKGYKNNNVGVSPNHALVLVNYNNDDGSAIADLAQTIQHKIKKQFHLDLQPEVRIL